MKIRKIITFILTLLLLFNGIVPVLAVDLKEGETIELTKDHDCVSLLKVKGEDVLKGVTVVRYRAPNETSINPAFCVQPSKAGIGTGAGESYDVTLESLNDPPVWRALYKGYMGTTYKEWNLEEDDDLYYATKTAIHCLMEEIAPNEKYEVPNRVGWGENVSLEEVQRRGEKVLNVAQQLYEYALNGTENYMEPKISVEQKGGDEVKTINNKQYVVQTYEIHCNRNIEEYLFDYGVNASELLILNSKDEVVTHPNENILKLAVPVTDLVCNIKGTFKIKEAKVKSYPVFYAKESTGEYQNYVVYGSKQEKITYEFPFEIDVYKSTVELTKIDEETKKPLEGVTFDVVYRDNYDRIGTFTTDKNGKIKIEKLRPTSIRITEVKTNNEYELAAEPTVVNLSYKSSDKLTISNKHKKGELEITKVDKEDSNILLEGVEFDLIDKDGKTVQHLVTDKKGKAYAKDLNIGEYTLKETKTNAKYKIGEDKKITINWNEKLELKLTNEKKKGQIQVIKQDKENNEIKLANVEFEVFDSNEKSVQKLKTDVQGTATTKLLPIGEYTIKELNTGNKYILNDTPIKVEVKDNEITKKIVNNERKKGKIKIVKTSNKESKILKINAGEPIEKAKFNIYNEKGKLVEQIVTNKDGIAESKDLDLGTYRVEETEAPKWFILKDNKTKVEIKENKEIVECKFENEPDNPEVNIEKETKDVVASNGEIDYEFNIENTGNVALSELTWYDTLPSNYAKITKIETGTYNQDIKYNIFYKTNLHNEYMVVKKDISSKENNYIDLSNINLQDEEKITEIKVCFGNVNVGFKNIEKPHIYMKANSDLINDTLIKNNTILEGYDNEYKVTDEDETTTTVYNVIEKKKLPRTGF